AGPAVGAIRAALALPVVAGLVRLARVPATAAVAVITRQVHADAAGRRARGVASRALALPADADLPVLALGAQRAALVGIVRRLVDAQAVRTTRAEARIAQAGPGKAFSVGPTGHTATATVPIIGREVDAVGMATRLVARAAVRLPTRAAGRRVGRAVVR